MTLVTHVDIQFRFDMVFHVSFDSGRVHKDTFFLKLSRNAKKPIAQPTEPEQSKCGKQQNIEGKNNSMFFWLPIVLCSFGCRLVL
jgi:hypothetical protein